MGRALSLSLSLLWCEMLLELVEAADLNTRRRVMVGTKKYEVEGDGSPPAGWNQEFCV